MTTIQRNISRHWIITGDPDGGGRFLDASSGNDLLNDVGLLTCKLVKP